MKRTRLGLVSLLSVVVLALLATPVAAQSTTTEQLITELNTNLLYIAVPVTLVTEAALVYAVWKFRKSDEAKPTKENRRLEITWTIATAIILLFVGVASYGVLANPNVTHTPDMAGPGSDDVVVDVQAYQWGWNFAYPRENVTASGATIVVPADTDVYFRITSQDVIHSFGVPDLGLKQDAVPGQTNTIKTHTLETGSYQGFCMEYCGVAHSQMLFTVKIVPQDQYDQYIQERNDAKSGSAGGQGAQQVQPSGALTAAA
ncbi:MAG: cytochrome c oxidase subunit II [Haloferacaceae archaeon]